MPPTQILLDPAEEARKDGQSKLSEFLMDPSDIHKEDFTDFEDNSQNEQTTFKSEAKGGKIGEHGSTPQSEVLPGLRPNSSMYHDLQGHYFIFNALKENKRYLRCIEPTCRVRASMRLYDGAPIVCSSDSVHNHRADFRRKNFVLFLQHCKQRALEETTNIQDIYAEEAKRDPVSAAMISSYNLIQRMMRARKHTTKYYPTVEDQSEFVQACTSTHTSTEVPPSELVNEDSCSQNSAGHYERPGKLRGKPHETKSELNEKRI
ncbi:hypothetical protein J6590_071303 [Homalodisca vitripennis]|nr:hypothetical protein J6590_071303 [Homalodisca vitripennis]